jgi:tetratricopeptide (TPR) repeat protein
MKRIAYWALPLLLIGAIAAPGFAQAPQAPNWKGTEYQDYMAVFNQKDEAVKAAAAEKYLVDHKDADATILTQIYQFMLMGYAKSSNWPKTLESVERMDVATKLSEAEKKQYVQIGLLAAANGKNNPKTVEYAEKVLKDDPKNFNALITLSGVLSQTLPNGPTKDAHIARTLDVTKQALAQPKPEGVTQAQWDPIQLQLRETACLMLLNQKKYEESITECQAALKINKKDAYAWYWIGLSHRAALMDLAKKYNDAVDTYNAGRDKGPLVVDELKAAMQGAEKVASDKRDETVDAFATAAAIGGDAGKQALQELQNGIFTGPADELTRIIEEKKKQLGY